MNFICLIVFLLMQTAGGAQDEIEDAMQKANQLTSIDPDTKEKLLSLVGSSGGDLGFSAATMIAYVLFGGIGTVAFFYGTKNRSPKPLIIGIVLGAYPYFISNTVLMYVVGIALTTLLYFWRD
jgi:hypothetical protein